LITSKPLTEVDVVLIKRGLKKPRGQTHALSGNGEALCRERKFKAGDPYGAGNARPAQALGIQGQPTCSFCLDVM
jgi:hypothetical protein